MVPQMQPDRREMALVSGFIQRWCFLSGMGFPRIRILGHSAGAGSAWPEVAGFLFPETADRSRSRLD